MLAAGGLSLFNSSLDSASGNEFPVEELPRWWPPQRKPKGIIRLTTKEGHSPALAMLAQSLSGLAAQAVNQDRGEELVWIDTPHEAYRRWYRATLQKTGIEQRGELDAWQLLARLRDQGIVHGFVRYRLDHSTGSANKVRDGIDLSVNVATSLCGVLGAVLIEDSLIDQAQELGLHELVDAREMSLSECFESHKDKFNRHLILAQDPRKPHMRELAIAHRAITLFGQENLVPSILAWLDPLSTVLGWNGGEEWVQVKQFSEYGHVLTVSDWAMGLPFLSIVNPENKLPQINGLDPRAIDWSWEGPCAALVMSDGDNVQWTLGDFTASRHEYWDAPTSGEFPFSWTAPIVPLTQTAPIAADHLARTKPDQTSLVEFGGGYIFPDVFGTKRNEDDLLEKYAARLGSWMEATDTRVLCLLLLDLDSPAAKHAYATFARNIPGLVGIIAMQYAPYEGGHGKVFWEDDGRGGQVPIMTCRYAIWEHANRPSAGTPSEIASQISRELPAEQSPEDRLAWTVVHAWSWFRESDDPTFEEVPQQQASRQGARRGHAVANWCQQRLGANVRAVTIEELLWRLRMAHNPDATKRHLE